MRVFDYEAAKPVYNEWRNGQSYYNIRLTINTVKRYTNAQITRLVQGCMIRDNDLYGVLADICECNNFSKSYLETAYWYLVRDIGIRSWAGLHDFVKTRDYDEFLSEPGCGHVTARVLTAYKYSSYNTVVTRRRRLHAV